MQRILFTFILLFLFSKNHAQQGFSGGADKELTCLKDCVVLDGKIPSSDWTFFWTDKKGFYSKNITPTICVSGTYTLTASYQGQTLTDEVTVFDNKIIPQADAGENLRTLTCLFPSAVINIKNPGIGFGVFIKGPDNFKSNSSNIKVNKTGLYVVEVFKGKCATYDTVQVIDNKKIEQAEAGKNALLTCAVKAVKLQPTTPQKEMSYEWIFDKKTISSELQLYANKVGKYFFKLKQGVCESIDSVEIKGDFRKPELSGVKDYQLKCTAPYCVSSAIKCLYEKEATFIWNDAKNQAFTTALNTQLCETGIFTLKSKLTANGCFDEIKIKVTKQDSIRFTTSIQGACDPLANGSLSIGAMTGGNQPYTFSLDNIDYQKDINFENLKVGVYTLSVKDSKGCKSATKVTIPWRKNFEWNLDTEYNFCSHDKPLIIDATVKDKEAGTVLYRWSDGSNEPEKTFVQSKQTWVEAKGECFLEKRYINIVDSFDLIREERFYAPTIFNPDSKNTENIGYKIFPAFPLLDFQMYIYNKQGNLLYYSNDANETWDGTFRGKKLNPEVYFWQIRASIDACGHPVPFNKTGSVMLLRS